MQLLFPICSNTKFYLQKAGYRVYGYYDTRSTYIYVDTKTKKAIYEYMHKNFKVRSNYIPKILTHTSLLDQIPLLEALGLSEKEIIEILRS